MEISKIFKHVIPRPGDRTGRYFVPNPTTSFWEEEYRLLREQNGIRHPIDDLRYTINPHFGQFGFRFHPITLKPNYFHIGIDFDCPIGTPLYAVAEGLFQYSGFGLQNGLYILISHPQIVTRQGFVLNSLYMHLQDAYFKFNSIQKIFRSIGFVKATDKLISPGAQIGTTGDSGNSKDIFPHLHLQLELRHPNDNRIIVISPSLYLGYSQVDNLTQNLNNLEEFKTYCEQNQADLARWQKLI